VKQTPQFDALMESVGINVTEVGGSVLSARVQRGGEDDGDVNPMGASHLILDGQEYVVTITPTELG
jgi:hypothetical protein